MLHTVDSFTLADDSLPVVMAPLSSVTRRLLRFWHLLAIARDTS
jgi:hypothetical protein